MQQRRMRCHKTCMQNTENNNNMMLHLVAQAPGSRPATCLAAMLLTSTLLLNVLPGNKYRLEIVQVLWLLGVNPWVYDGRCLGWSFYYETNGAEIAFSNKSPKPCNSGHKPSQSFVVAVLCYLCGPVCWAISQLPLCLPRRRSIEERRSALHAYTSLDNGGGRNRSLQGQLGSASLLAIRSQQLAVFAFLALCS